MPYCPVVCFTASDVFVWGRSGGMGREKVGRGVEQARAGGAQQWPPLLPPVLPVGLSLYQTC